MLPEENRKSRQEDMTQQMREQTSASVTTRMDFSTYAYRAASHKRVALCEGIRPKRVSSSRRYVSSHLSRMAQRNGSTHGSTAEADATRTHLNHDGSVRQCFSSCEAKSQSANRATSPQKGNESAGVDSVIKGNCGPVPLIGQFWTVATNAKLPVTV
jgi:hypothetical protein